MLTAQLSGTAARGYGAPPEFGAALALEGDNLVVGAPGEDNIYGNDGAVYVFHQYGDRWEHTARLVGPNATDNARFGQSVALRGRRILVGMPEYDSTPGSAHIFHTPLSLFGSISSSTWVHEATLKPRHSDDEDDFGWAVALSDARAVVGAPRAYPPPDPWV